MSRVINPNTAGKQRTQLLRGIALALRELALQDQPDGKTQDLVAFIILALDAINETIDQTVVAWEKRGYWLKADRFRLDWAWSENFSYRLNVGLSQQNWPEVALLAAQISEKIKDVKLPKRNRLGTPWIGALDQLNQKNNHNSMGTT